VNSASDSSNMASWNANVVPLEQDDFRSSWPKIRGPLPLDQRGIACRGIEGQKVERCGRTLPKARADRSCCPDGNHSSFWAESCRVFALHAADGGSARRGECRRQSERQGQRARNCRRHADRWTIARGPSHWRKGPGRESRDRAGSGARAGPAGANPMIPK
jgi:hypothetical protein